VALEWLNFAIQRLIIRHSELRVLPMHPWSHRRDDGAPGLLGPRLGLALMVPGVVGLQDMLGALLFRAVQHWQVVGQHLSAAEGETVTNVGKQTTSACTCASTYSCTEFRAPHKFEVQLIGCSTVAMTLWIFLP